MSRKRQPPSDPVPARIGMPGPGARTFVRCGHCGQRLPDLVITSDGAIHIGDWDAWGWTIDGEALRPTNDHRARRQRARKIVRTSTQREMRTAQKLRGNSLFFRYTDHQGPALRDDPLIPMPERIECPRCGAVNKVVARRAVE